MQPGLFFPLYHTNKAVKDFNVLLTLAVYDRAFSDLDVVNQFLNDFPVKLLHIQIAADDACPLPDIFNLLPVFLLLCQKNLQTLCLLETFLFAFLNQDGKGIVIDYAADLIFIKFSGHVFQFSDTPPQPADFQSGILLSGCAFGKYLLSQLVQHGIFILCHRPAVRPDFIQHQRFQRDFINPVPGTGAASGGDKVGADIGNISLGCPVFSALGLTGGYQRMPAIGTDQLAGEQGRQRGGTVCCLLFDCPVLFLNRLPQFPVNDCFVGILVANPFRFRLLYHGLILVGTGAGAVLCDYAEINGVIQDVFHCGIGPQFGVFAASFFPVVQFPMPAGRKDAFLVQRRRNLAVGHAGAAHPVDFPYYRGSFFIHHQPVFVLVALAVSVRSIGGQVLAAFLFGVQHRFDFPRQVFQMVVVHQTAEVQHIGVVTFAVQTVQHRHKPAAQGRENHIRIAAYLHKVTPQAGQVFDQNQVNQAVAGILQHFQKSGPLKISAAVPIVPIGLDLDPAVEHDKFGEDFVLVFNTGGFIAGDIILCLCGIGGIVHAQAAVNADLILLLQVAASFLPAPAPRPHCPHNGSKHGGHKPAVHPLFWFLQPQCGPPVQRGWTHPAP